MTDLMSSGPPFCDPSLDNCGQPWAPLFALGIQFIITLILVNTFIAIVVDTFYTMLQKEKEITAREKAIDEFCRLWTRVDPGHSWWVELTDFMDLLEQFRETWDQSAAGKAAAKTSQDRYRLEKAVGTLQVCTRIFMCACVRAYS